MSTQLVVCCALAVLCSCPARAFDLDVNLRVHRTRVQFGDPVYVEVTITNKGKEVIEAPPPGFELNDFCFVLTDTGTGTSRIEFQGGGVGGIRPIRYEPGQKIREYGMIFLPSLTVRKQPFWASLQDGGEISICGHYSLTDRLILRSGTRHVEILERNPDEVGHLEKWANAQFDYSEGPSPTDFGIAFRSKLNREDTLQLISTMKESELSDLIQLTIRLQELYAPPTPEAREKYNALLVEWLREQPDIKRQTLIQKTGRIAKHYKLSSTTEAVDALVERLRGSSASSP